MMPVGDESDELWHTVIERRIENGENGCIDIASSHMHTLRRTHRPMIRLWNSVNFRQIKIE